MLFLKNVTTGRSEKRLNLLGTTLVANIILQTRQTKKNVSNKKKKKKHRLIKLISFFAQLYFELVFNGVDYAVVFADVSCKLCLCAAASWPGHCY